MAYAQYGRNALRQICNNRSLQSSDRMINPLLYASQGIRYRTLKVILTTRVANLGKAGETVEVAPGYFRNHLMPKLLAVPNIDKYAYLIKEQRKIYQPEEAEEVEVVKETVVDRTKEYQTAAKRLAKSRLNLRRLINVKQMRARSTKDEPIELQKPVTKHELVAEVAKQLCVQLHPNNVVLSSDLTTLGEYQVPLRFPKSLPLPEGKTSWVLNVKVRSK